jgi:hypothetical protein
MGVPQGPVSLVERPRNDPLFPRELGFESHQPPQGMTCINGPLGAVVFCGGLIGAN